MSIEEVKKFTEEEIESMNKAGEKSMYDFQTELSERREMSSKLLREKFKAEGFLEVLDGEGTVSGVLNGHAIVIKPELNPDTKQINWVGRVDGKIVLAEKKVQEFLGKYESAIVRFKTLELEKGGNLEKLLEEQTLRDIGL